MCAVVIYIQMSETTLRDFVPLEKLGEGSFSTVYKVKRVSDGKIYALKKVRMNNLKEKEKLSAVNQIRILASIDSPYIVSYKEAIYDQNLNLLCIVMEYASAGDLQRCIKSAELKKSFIPEKEIWKAIIHILKGLDHLHKKNILHRDLKSANIFLSDTLYKLGDLNVSKVNKGRLAYTQIGTPYYASPEVWREEPYDCKSDVWSFGCIIYEMATLKPPFQGRNMEDLYENVQKGTYSKLPSCYSKDLQTTIDFCLRKTASSRPSAQQLLEHPIVAKYILKYLNQEELTKSNVQQELLRTIKVPFNMKGLQKNLPKSKYDNTSTKQQSSTQKTGKDLHRYSQRNVNYLRLEGVANRNPSLDALASQKYSPRSIQLPKHNSSPRNYLSGINIESGISPRSKIQPIRLPVAKSLQKTNRESKKSDRYLQMDSKREDLSSYKMNELKQIQRSLVLQQNQIQEYIQKQLNQRPVTCIPKTEQGLIKSNIHKVDYGKICKRRQEFNQESHSPDSYKQKMQYVPKRQSSLQNLKQQTGLYSPKLEAVPSTLTNKPSQIMPTRNCRKLEPYKYPPAGVHKVGQYKSKLSPSYWVQ